jgi:NADPH:quinone reductase-like Zn-dependent oxidoreductase
MKALRLREGIHGLEAIFLDDVPQPRPAPGQVLVKVQAAGVTPSELGWSTNWTTKAGLARRLPIPGHEFCGVVCEVGDKLGQDLIGTQVYGLTDFNRDGVQAEYALALPEEIAPCPPALDPSKAAALPLSALTAWQALFDHAGLIAGQAVLIHGAAGGVGSQAVQLATWAGAYVIATASLSDLGFVRELGAQEAIPYTHARFEKIVNRIDVVIDTVGGETLERSWGVMKKKGILVSVASVPPPEKAGSHQVRAAFFIVRPDRAQLVKIGDLVKRGKIRPVLDSTFPFDQVRLAYEHAQNGRPRGKVVLQIAD